MTKLSDKIKIVSADGEVIREAGSSGPAKDESMNGKLGGLLAASKKKDIGEYDSEDLSASDSIEKESIIDKVKGFLPVGKKKDTNRTEEDVLEVQFPDLDDEAGDHDDEGNDSDGIPEEQRKWYIAGVVGLVILMVVSFVWYISSSKVDAVDVQPEAITNEEVSHILNGDPDSFHDLLHSIGSELNAEEQDDEIPVDFPEEKEELAERVKELEEVNDELRFENNALQKENEELITRAEQAERLLSESKEKIEELELGNEKLKKGAGESK